MSSIRQSIDSTVGDMHHVSWIQFIEVPFRQCTSNLSWLTLFHLRRCRRSKESRAAPPERIRKVLVNFPLLHLVRSAIMVCVDTLQLGARVPLGLALPDKACACSTTGFCVMRSPPAVCAQPSRTHVAMAMNGNSIHSSTSIRSDTHLRSCLGATG